MYILESIYTIIIITFTLKRSFDSVGSFLLFELVYLIYSGVSLLRKLDGKLHLTYAIT